MYLFQIGSRIFAFEDFSLDPVEIDLHLVGKAAVIKRLDQRLIGILEPRVLANDGNSHFAFWIVETVGNLFPAIHARLRSRIDTEGRQDFRIKAFLMIGNRNIINRGHVERLNDSAFTHITEQRQLAAFRFRNLTISTNQKDIWSNADRTQFLD